MRKDSRGHLAPLMLVALWCASAHPATAQQCGLPSAPGGTACDTSHDPGSSPRQKESSNGARHIGNPVEIATGNKYERTLDFRSIASPLTLTRHYNSDDANINTGTGFGWRHSYQVSLSRVDTGRLRIVQADGRRILFDGDGEKGWVSVADGGIHVRDNGYVWTWPTGRELQFERGRLTSIHYRNDAAVNLDYENSQLQRVTADNGLTLHFHWAEGSIGLPRWQERDGSQRGSNSGTVPAGHLSHVSLPDGSRIAYAYTSDQLLTKATYKDELLDDVDTIAEYEYEAPELPRHLTTVRRATQLPISEPRASDTRITRSWTYDAYGRAISGSTTTVGSTNEQIDWTIQRNGHPHTERAGTGTIKHSNGHQQTYQWTAHKSYDPARHAVGIEYGEVSQKSQSGQAHDQENRSNDIRAALSSREAVPGSLSSQITLRSAKALGQTPVAVLVTADHTGRATDLLVEGRSLDAALRSITDTDSQLCTQLGNPNLAESATRLAQQQACPADLAKLNQLRSSVAVDAASDPDLEQSSIWPFGDRFCELPDGQNCAQMEDAYALAQLSDCVYKEPSRLCPPGWDPVAPGDIGLQANELSIGDFHAELFREAGTDRFVLVFRGTDQLADLGDSVRQVLGSTSGRYDLANQLARDLNIIVDGISPNSSLEFSGHSLGGGLATAAAANERGPATVFNPSALSPATTLLNGGGYISAWQNTNVYRVSGEFLHTLDRLPAPGSHTVLARPPGAWPNEILDLHSMSSVLDSIREYLRRHCTATSP